jgi:hypothetical protein
MHLWNFKDAEKLEEFFYKVYEDVLNIVGTSTRPFKNFDKDNYDSLTRLKWKWLA